MTPEEQFELDLIKKTVADFFAKQMQNTVTATRKNTEQGDYLEVRIDKQSINIPLLSSQVNRNGKIR